MENLYFFVTKCSTWIGDTHFFLKTYFVDEGAFATCLFIALGAAVVFAALFYGWIGMTSSKLSNVPVWLVTLALVGLSTLALTRVSIIGSKAEQSGVFGSMYTQTDELLRKPGMTDIDRDNLQRDRDNLMAKIENNCDVVLRLYLVNVIISLVIFFVISLFVKNFTVHAIAVPLAKP